MCLRDFAVNGERTVLLTLDTPTGETVPTTLTEPTVGADGSATLSILDNDAFPVRLSAGSFQFLATTASANENGDSIPLIILRTDGASGAASVVVSFSADSAKATRDFTGDGDADVVIMSKAKKSIFLLRGNGDGTFETPQAFLSGKATKTLITADFNGDGRLDLAALQSKGVNVLLNIGNGFGLPTTLSAGKALGALVAADFTGDGRIDLAVTNGGLKPAITVLASTGTDGFAAPLISRLGKSTPGLKATSVVAGDFDRDGKLDLAGIISKNRFALFTGIGAGRFGTNDIVAAPKGAKFVVTADFEDDLDLDLAVTAAKKTVSGVTNSGSGQFMPGTLIPANFAPTKLYACDLDGDEDADLIFANNKDKFKVLLGSAGATFIDPSITARIAAVIAGDASV